MSSLVSLPVRAEKPRPLTLRQTENSANILPEQAEGFQKGLFNQDVYYGALPFWQESLGVDSRERHGSARQ